MKPLLALAFLLTVSSVGAQTPTATVQPADSLVTIEALSRVELALGGAAAGAVAWFAAEQAFQALGADEGLGLFVYPLGVAAGVYGTARLRGADVPFGRALRGAGRGALLGVGVAAGLLVVGISSGSTSSGGGGGGGLLIATALIAALPVAGAVVEVTPSRVRTPDGERVAVLSLRIGL